MEFSIFIFLACGSVLAGMLAISCRKPAHSVLYLAATSLCVGLLCIPLSAPFLALAQVLICAAGVALLGLFVCAVLSLESERRKEPLRILSAVVAVGIVLGALGRSLWRWRQVAGGPMTDVGIPFGELVFGEFLLPVELAAFLLLVALLGSVLLTRRERGEKTADAGRSGW